MAVRATVAAVFSSIEKKWAEASRNDVRVALRLAFLQSFLRDDVDDKDGELTLGV